ncbi:unnamed protein product [Musa acuminata var. zebrina]
MLPASSTASTCHLCILVYTTGSPSPPTLGVGHDRAHVHAHEKWYDANASLLHPKPHPRRHLHRRPVALLLPVDFRPHCFWALLLDPIDELQELLPRGHLHYHRVHELRHLAQLHRRPAPAGAVPHALGDRLPRECGEGFDLSPFSGFGRIRSRQSLDATDISRGNAVDAANEAVMGWTVRRDDKCGVEFTD